MKYPLTGSLFALTLACIPANAEETITAKQKTSSPEATTPPVAEAQKEEIARPQWKIAYFIFPKVKATLGKREVDYEMSPERLKQFTDNGAMMDAWIQQWSGGIAKIQVDCFVMDEPLTTMSPLRGNFWPAPEDTKALIIDKVRAGNYDSVVIGLDNNAYRPNYAGLGLTNQYTQNAIKTTYAVTTNPWDETFIHEWMHGSNSYVRHTFKVDCPDPHENGKMGVGKQNGGWKHWYKMLLSGTAPRDGKPIAGYSKESWAKGGPYFAKRQEVAQKNQSDK